MIVMGKDDIVLGFEMDNATFLLIVLVEERLDDEFFALFIMKAKAL
jgi:hypothetical protein